jgi:hypothetical protein
MVKEIKNVSFTDAKTQVEVITNHHNDRISDNAGITNQLYCIFCEY